MEEKDERTLHKPTQGERLGAFAGSHFQFSVFGAMALVAGGLIGLELEQKFGYEVFFALLIFGNLLFLAIYFGLGLWSAKNGMWSAPVSVWEGILAFLFPALIAWGWGGLVLAVAENTAPYGYALATAVLWLSFLLASPSFLMVFTAFAFGWMDGGLPNMTLCVLVVGGLPPLLFLLGSIWGGRREKRVNETGKGEPNGI